MIPPDARDSVFINTVPLMNIISHQIEDVVIDNGLQVNFYVGFQRFSYITRQVQRYKRLAAVCRRIYVWGVPDVIPPPIPGVEYIPLVPTDALAQEWFLVIDSPQFFTALLTHETTYGQLVPKGQRHFQGVWTYDPGLVSSAYLVLSQILRQPYIPVGSHNYEQQSQYLVQISNRLAKRQDRQVAQQALDTQRSALLNAGLTQSDTPLLLVDTEEQVLATSYTASTLLNAPADTLVGHPLRQVANGILSSIELATEEQSPLTILQIADGATLAARSTAMGRPDHADGWLITLYAPGGIHRAAQGQLGAVASVAPILQRQLGVINQSLAMWPTHDTSDTQQRMIGQIRRAVDDMNNSMDRIALLSDIAHFGMPHAAPEQLSKLINTTLQELMSAASKWGVNLCIEAIATQPLVVCNGELVGMALRELIHNAIEASLPGTNVMVRLDQQSHFARIRVSDTGAGIAPADLPLLFEPFYLAQRDAATQTRGLGLTLVRAIALAHGGHLVVHSRLDQGSTFAMLLPL
jgi:signal transduction histidine kinase